MMYILGYYISQAKINNEQFNFTFSSNLITDKRLENYFQKLIDNDYAVVCKTLIEYSHVEFPKNILISTSVIADNNYSSEFEKLNVQQKLYLLGIKNYDKMISENDSRHMASIIANQLMDKLGDRYNFGSIQVYYIDKFGAYEIVINKKTLTLEELLKHTRKLDSNNIGEEEKVFIEHLNL